ncbi:MAG: TIGR03643 family protein [Akkermansiaceae bacterium]|jgi:uncharacterized protein (TIGR03643 family)|nr:TIGR03643 family protein [Akkermansiaceae bacterium]
MGKPAKLDLTPDQTSAIIRMAWEDRTTFDEIQRKTGIPESGVIKIMRRELKSSSFRLWRKRVTGRMTKHEKIFRATRKELKDW